MFVNSFGQKKIAANGKQQKQDEHATRFKIKKQTKDQQVNSLHFVATVHQAISC
jgi:hypothetical protein